MSTIDQAQGKIKKLYERFGASSVQIPKQLQSVEWAYIAIEFLAAASVLDKKEPHFTKPRLQLTEHAIECAMKACITSVAKKPPNTHDLVRLYREIEKLGFSLDNRSEAWIVHLNHHYYQDLGTGTKFKLRYPAESAERTGGTIPPHADMVAISNALLEQAADKAPDILQEMFNTIPTYSANLAMRA